MLTTNDGKTGGEINGNKIESIPANLSCTDPVSEALKVTFPFWPIQNAVAVNPFWNLKQKRFSETLERLYPVCHSSLYLPLSYYQKAYEAGQITREDLSQALNEQGMSSTIEEMLKFSSGEEPKSPKISSLAGYLDGLEGSHIEVSSVNDLSKFTAAYLDEKQSSTRFPWKDRNFLAGWLEAIRYDRAMEIVGIRDFRKIVQEFKTKDARTILSEGPSRMGLTEAPALTLYFERLLFTCIGWASQFSLFDWQERLGLSEKRASTLDQMLAVRFLYDFALFEATKKEKQAEINRWREIVITITQSQSAKTNTFEIHHTWLRALELSCQRRISASFSRVLEPDPKPAIQVAFCIDVRSEMYRRHLEVVSPDLQTIGFA